MPEPRESVEHSTARPPTKVFRGHELNSIISCVVYFHDGRQIASGSSDMTVRIWNVESGQQEGESLIHYTGINGIAISPDGKNITSRVTDKVVVWNVARREKLYEIKMLENDVLSWTRPAVPVAYSTGGRWIAAGSLPGDKLHLWDLDTGSPAKKPLTSVKSVKCLAFSPNGPQIASSPGRAKAYVRVWDAKTGQEIGQPLVLEHTHNNVSCLAVIVGGRRVVSGSFDNTVRVWDLETRLQTRGPFHAQSSIYS
ncbi:WD40 repeat-like protein [Leucogyrophana mollusca]|uniref:WD40 repeat-like protein n=1 Tax=Leucogyrophana mollusca TaxID=85980 RepID=A0ACB8B0Z7_9AGAM|nr:WD40 repeat-like protein [Leucogyrophana mollusca]